MAKRIVGIDPGTVRLGYGVLEECLDHRRNLAFRCLAAGTLSAPRTWKLAHRLARLQAELQQVLVEWRPDCVAMETSFYGKNPQSLLRLGEARGMVIGLAASLDHEVADYSPAMVKKAVTGRGNARKEVVARLLPAQVQDLPAGVDPDRSDAIAVALCHLHRARLQSLLARS